MFAITIFERLSSVEGFECTAQMNSFFLRNSAEPAEVSKLEGACGVDNPSVGYLKAYVLPLREELERVTQSHQSAWHDLVAQYPDFPEGGIALSSFLALAAEGSDGFARRDLAVEAQEAATKALEFGSNWQAKLALGRAKALLGDVAGAREAIGGWEPATDAEAFALGTFQTRTGSADLAKETLKSMEQKKARPSLDPQRIGCKREKYSIARLSWPDAPSVTNWGYRMFGQERAGGCGDFLASAVSFIPFYKYDTTSSTGTVYAPQVEIERASYLSDPEAKATFNDQDLTARQVFTEAVSTGNTEFAKRYLASSSVKFSDIERFYVPALAAWAVDNDATASLEHFKQLDQAKRDGKLQVLGEEDQKQYAEAMVAAAVIARRSGNDEQASYWQQVAEPYVLQIENRSNGFKLEPTNLASPEEILAVWRNEKAIEAIVDGDSESAYEQLKKNEEDQQGVSSEAVTPGALTPAEAANANNLALVAIKDPNRVEEAVENATKALNSDPTNPVFLYIYAWVLTQASEDNYDTALTAYEKAIEADPSNFDSWNNAAVLTAKAGDTAKSIHLLRNAVGVKPEYALGWSNLSTLLSQEPGLWNSLRAQGAWAKAISLDPNLRGASPELAFDDKVYGEVIDLAMPVGLDWQIAKQVRLVQSQAAWGTMITSVIAFVLVGVRSWLSGKSMERVLGSPVLARLSNFFSTGTIRMTSKSKSTTVRRLPVYLAASWIAVLISSLLLARYSGGGGPSDRTTLVLMFLMMALVVTVPVWARLYLLGRDVTYRYATWWPLVAIGVVSSLAGSLMVPEPTLRNDDARAQQRRKVGLFTLVGITVIALVMSVLTNVPLVRGVAMAGTVTLATLLIPIKPLDGGYFKPSKFMFFAPVGLLIIGILFETSII
ncbi:MAG: tetratricopeptide repeat protein [Actinomycetaceae bacterium]|nr:tetratricopeptide repeat protein [Actinomycetaceae bacterium]